MRVGDKILDTLIDEKYRFFSLRGENLGEFVKNNPQILQMLDENKVKPWAYADKVDLTFDKYYAQDPYSGLCDVDWTCMLISKAFGNKDITLFARTRDESGYNASENGIAIVFNNGNFVKTNKFHYDIVYENIPGIGTVWDLDDKNPIYDEEWVDIEYKSLEDEMENEL